MTPAVYLRQPADTPAWPLQTSPPLYLHPEDNRGGDRSVATRDWKSVTSPTFNSTFRANRFARGDENTNNHAGKQELHVGREAAGSVPPSASVKHLASARAQQRDDVLEIGGGACCCSKSRRIERSTLSGEKDETEEAAADLEAARGDVSVWQSVTGKVEDRSDNEGSDPRTGRGAGCGARGDVKRNDHSLLVLAPAARAADRDSARQFETPTRLPGDAHRSPLAAGSESRPMSRVGSVGY
jgi:hypothetical protein